MIYTTGTIAINGNTVTGTGTDFSAPLSLIRVGCTLIAIGNPVQIFTITEIKNGTELSVTPAANPAIPAGTKFSILLSDSISVDGLAQDVAETLRYYQSKETEVAEALEWSQNHIADKIGLGADHRDWPDCNDPTGYIGFCRAVEAESRNFPSIASGEIYLVGWLARGDNAVINGCFVGTISLSLYTYRYNPTDGTKVWTRHARKDEVSRLAQGSDESALWAAGGKQKFVLLDGGDGNTLSWGVWDDAVSQWSPLAIAQGGTGALDALTARNNLGVGVGDSPQFRDVNLSRSTDESSGLVSGGIQSSILLGSDGTKRAEGLFYVEHQQDKPTQVTLSVNGANEGYKYLCFNTMGQILVDTAIFRSNGTNPLIIKSNTPTILFVEEDRPNGSPYYSLNFDDGNWRIQKSGNGYNGEYVINYDYQKNEIEVPKLKASRMSILGTGSSLEINSAGTADETTSIQSWGNRSDRLSVFEVSLDTGYLFYAQKNADKSMVLSVNGKIECVSLSQSSDRDLKDNIKIISDATEAIRKMNGYTYTLKENGLPYAGVIAQEVMEAIPEAIGSFTKYGEELAGPTQSGHELREETRFLSVDYAAVTGLLVQVARETDNRVTELEEENASLRDNIAAMDERIAKLEALVSKLTGSEK
ncbi:tail fiber domain-containing protein [Escherichia coli]|uniref:tail fiber domain-containing protein n=1 Tax=Escherichia coli TaxID=562 RepID=UPI00098CAE03|nr:tail fiber domain-containing protein [Escherichia coli]